jgi:hypothetical protein
MTWTLLRTGPAPSPPPLCTRRGDGLGGRLSCPGALGYCEACPSVPEKAMCRACCAEVPIRDREHANRVTGGFGCGRDGCPPPRWRT